MKKMKSKFNRLIYLFFITIGLLSLVMQEYMVSISLLGLAILFDPFDINQRWSKKTSLAKDDIISSKYNSDLHIYTTNV